MSSDDIDPNQPPSGEGCVECLQSGGWWFHLRRCAKCGHIGCCDSSPGQHGSKHFRATGHRVMQSFEPGEEWFWNFETDHAVNGPALAPPHSHPESQPVPGPDGSVPDDWDSQLH